MLSVLEIKIVFEQFGELHRNRPRLREERSPLPQVAAKVFFESRIYNHDRLSNESAILRPTDIKDVRKPGDVGNIKIAFQRSKRMT